ncbi:MAG: KpsF/GutQ family sugar-phosphate isomerase [Phycisphaerae bacterium]|nr:KpsF/GutQ family sugar-phosphate isomerase [Saprospiraceae bacterium]
MSQFQALDPILDIARHTIRLEAEALLALANSLDDSPDFQRLVEDVAAAPSSRLVITGIGKSAIVAQKIAATLNSTGTPALFLHAADAIHGDLGMVQPADFVICLSKSGETPEIRVLAPLVKNFGNPLVAITANRQSSLARQANYLLYTPIEQEADPNNLAPTTSTTSQMALGDALAVALLSKKGFGSEDFAKFHPGGALGKQLYLRVQDLYTLNERPVVGPDATLPEVILEISSKRLGATAVVTREDELLGVITDGDLRRMLQRGGDFNVVCARDILSPAPKSVSPDTLAVNALALMRQHSISQLLVVDNGHFLGIVHLHDLLREGLV